ncbi:hypothetical protein BJ973_007303 [Actinoplanes tereljensis]|uniref:Uncharacterized protein n=1 Tax=Paractinoplanes tereljensis TaxID=571912 RepID=A0A919NW48_9ACTN|nr:hypothetical protein [Actinoplanes tereljensis]GIF25046.1 hypothetical protein Ate02nite_77760 [Actinoplanes tereljensis]
MSYDPYRPPHKRASNQPPFVSGQLYGNVRTPQVPIIPGTQHLPEPTPVPPPPAATRPRWPYVLLAAAVLFLAGGVWTGYSKNLILKDSGIKACEAFRDGTKVDGAPIDTKADGKMTSAQYLQLRKIFKGSRYDDIEQAGTRLMDVLWQVTQLGENPGLEALPFVGQMTDALTSMQGACANHDIVIKIAKH